MLIAGRDKLEEFLRVHADARSWIGTWVALTEKERWRSPEDIKRNYANASFLSDNIVIFNVKGNRYRLEVKVQYQTGVVIIRWAGTHAEYTKRFK